METKTNQSALPPQSTFTENSSAPEDRLAGLKRHWKNDIQTGLIVFLIALPLCLGIAIASGFPPMAGIFSAVIGGLVVSHCGGSFVTINGPAAGLIVVILASVERLGGGQAGYHATLAAIVIAGLVLFIMGLCKTGKLSEFFPSSVVHGMLAAIGIIIMAKQLPFVLGVQPPAKEPLELIARIPQMFQSLNPEIAAIGFVSLIILVVHGLITNKVVKRIPAPIVVVLVSIFMGAYFDLGHAHQDVVGGHAVQLGPKFLVSLPSNIAQAVAFPDFAKVASYAFILSVVSITIVQALETLLSAAAVEKLDPFRRRVDLNKDLAAMGIASAISGAIGGLPMIAEIVRSTANISNGALTRWSNFFHAAFMLIAVIFCSVYINQIPLAALAALLVFTGYRLASPKVFNEAYEIGRDQLFIFVTTVVATLQTDLLVGVLIGIAVKLALELMQGVPIRSLFKATIMVEQSGDDSLIVRVEDAATFSNFMSLKRQLENLGHEKNLIVDLTSVRLIDHTVMERLHEYSEEYVRHGKECRITGLAEHKSASNHPFAVRRLARSRQQR
ncbi:MAG: SulP family inorganic anion transporter [Candidatus Melainabacteria bacterium]|nr:SulP family inorganic anion transporter [Candidatus Melainabacteria bacterium]